MILGIGIDLCEVGRVERLLLKDRSRFLRRVFRDGEAAYCDGKRHPAIHYAARLAAKEAFLKAVGTGWSLGWRQVEVVRGREGKPRLSILGKAALVLDRRSVTGIHLTLTHTRESALAVVILEGDLPPSPSGERR